MTDNQLDKYKVSMETFNIFYGLFETGDYHVIVEKFISLLDLDTLHSLSLCNKSCYKFLTPHISRKKHALRMSWLSPMQPHKMSFIQRKDISRSMVVCDDFEMILIGFTNPIGWNAYVSYDVKTFFSLKIFPLNQFLNKKIFGRSVHPG